MKKTFLSFTLLIFLSFFLHAQNILKQAPQGFDSLITNIAHDMFAYLGVFSSGWWANNTKLSDPQYDFMKKNPSLIVT